MGTMRISLLLSTLLLAETESSIQEVSLSKILSRPHLLSKTVLSNTVYDIYITILYDLYDLYPFGWSSGWNLWINILRHFFKSHVWWFFLEKNIFHVFILKCWRKKIIKNLVTVWFSKTKLLSNWKILNIL